MRALILIALAGFAAQLVDGGIGMGFGVTSTTILLLAGLGPAQASAVVHTAELGTTFASGISHWRFGNVHWPTVLALGVPGGIAACAGALLLSSISLEAATPWTSAILTVIGVSLVWRFSRGRTRRAVSTKHHSRGFLVGLGLVGGFVDASGGGGWGPVSTSTLMAVGREQPRRIVGTVNTAEFLVTFGATAGFVVGLWEELVAHAAAVGALLVGGVLAAPVAAWLVSRVNPVALGGLVGTAIVVLNLPKIIDVPAWAQLIIAIIGVTATITGVRRYRRALAADQAADAAAANEQAAGDVAHNAKTTPAEAELEEDAELAQGASANSPELAYRSS
ncbi:sulfite exporter TauE/SafE family protein [Corynebacterium lizhenjunii]|uniref:Probable membrane transporter protein n=1 Tax=Corynebacterium lizhenjunii TaxID=2709394 RepID=A0A7T0PB17_9CORY|nr:sulfite exporter TauE/SafE family protein [Corynebacterium lizhenjunii]QPK79681.1 sulfite exporter TauE/SafE family protein [Corynebacterium lizhenjunii]